MVGRELEAGKRWVEERFEAIAQEFGSPRNLAAEDRWRHGDAASATKMLYMRYCVEVEGHVILRNMTFGDIDVQDAGAGEQDARERIERHIRHEFEAYRKGR